MISALFYLRLTSLQNNVRTRLRRLRQPKYLLGAVVGVAYFWYFFFRPLGGGMRAATLTRAVKGLPVAPGFSGEMLAAFGALLLLAFATLAWILPTEKPGLAFTEAEVAFLFPAPLSRRMLIHFKLLSSQFRILFTSLFFTLLTNRWSTLGGNALTHALGWWVILSALSLHSAGAVLTLTRLMDGGVSPLKRRMTVIGGLALVLLATVAWVWHDLRAPTAAEAAGPGSLLVYGLAQLNGGALRWLLWPFRLVIRPFLAPDTAGFFLSLAPALLILGMLYFWVTRMNVAFEEASLGLAEKRGAAIAAWRAGKRLSVRQPVKGRPGPFALASTGRPELAFLWKNLLSITTLPTLLTWRAFRLCAAGLIVLCLWLTHHPAWHAAQIMLGTTAAGLGCYILLLGPQLARQDLRSDFAHADILRTYPMPGWQVVLGELLAPVAILTGLLWLVLLTAGLSLGPFGPYLTWLTPTLRITGGVCLAVVIPPLVALQLLVPNAAVVLFPGWFQSGAARSGGIDVMGQRLIFGFGQMFVLLLALLPLVFSAVILVAAFYWIIGTTAAVIFATGAVLVVLIGEVWCGVWLIGERFEKLDLSAEGRP